MEDLVDRRLQQPDIVRDHDQAARVGRQIAAQPDDRVGVEVVGGLVQQHGVGTGEQDAGQFDPPPLTAGERPQRLGQHPVGQAQVGRESRGLGLGRVATRRGQFGLGPRVGAHRGLLGLAGLLGHRHGVLREPLQNLVQPARGEDPVLGQLLQITGPRILRQVPQLPRTRHLTGRGQPLPRQNPGERGLAGAIASDQPDPVARGDLETHRGQQQPGTSPDFDLSRNQHNQPFSQPGRLTPNRG